MHNKEIRNAARIAGVCLWLVADAYGVTDSHFSRKLRKELPDAEKAKILRIIERIAQEQQGVV